MAEPNSQPETLRSLMSSMEDDVHDVARWGHVLMAMCGSPSVIERDAVDVIGKALHRLGQSLEERHERAYALVLSRP